MLYGLKKQREDQGLTQSQLAEKLGVSRLRVNRLENGSVNSITPKELKTLIELGFSLDEIFQDSKVA
ncbi:helix-turn-helix transcriptional regulator [Synechococcus sp. PCC 6312]|uniref:helix-turn-helix transcriptional regulator n=1 Tax=Synechococcus sp. (strain ATCC 27167 / PCC 6312) TaxID=195253 RepID=UPI00029EF2CC|nr:helix-turn-helix transcriptional regulator [Synechococcus sp. PCC 6312]AFY60541.1 putative transcriptional regulator [Synechococcus sp. PCC 6312]